MKLGAQIPFQLNYSALLRAMTSPFIAKIMNKPRVKIDTGSA